MEDLAQKRNLYERTFEEHRAVLQSSFQLAWDICARDTAIAKVWSTFHPW
jgi:hypothetical protein